MLKLKLKKSDELLTLRQHSCELLLRHSSIARWRFILTRSGPTGRQIPRSLRTLLARSPQSSHPNPPSLLEELLGGLRRADRHAVAIQREGLIGLGPAHCLEVEVFGERCSGNHNVTTVS
jgi:hypothetical protein